MHSDCEEYCVERPSRDPCEWHVYHPVHKTPNKGNDVFLLKHDDPKRKLKYGLEIIKSRNNLVGVNTHMANKIAHHGLKNNLK